MRLGVNDRKDNVLFLGITGGIASGKTTVANMLKELGSPIIDFDILARQVVEPGKPAWKEIVDFFGKKVLQEDGRLARKRLSSIVFQDKEKRKKLESLTHSRILDECMQQVNEIARKEPDAIIQLVIPLLFEADLSHLVHKVLLVYIPPDKQIERLINRDAISKGEAGNILKAQLPIDEKVSYADFVIHNEDSLEVTRRHVRKVWDKLKNLQEQRCDPK